MNLLKRLAFPIFLSGIFATLPVLGSGLRGIVGVAQGAGTIQINGQPFGGQASLFSGDRISTGTKSPLMVISSPAERMRFEPGTEAQLSKENRITVIRLNWGTVDFSTGGAIRAALPDGVRVQPETGKATVAQVSRLAEGNDEISVYKGSVTVADASESVSVTAGHAAIVGPNISGAQNGRRNKKNRKKMLAIFIPIGLSAGAVAAVLANNQTNFVSIVDP